MADKDNKELFRLASLIGCEPEDEARHRKELLDFINQRESKLVEQARYEQDVDTRYEILNKIEHMRLHVAREAFTDNGTVNIMPYIARELKKHLKTKKEVKIDFINQLQKESDSTQAILMEEDS